jgi:flavin reductase (DIM6/NTAB) family NADH-FMN oxidoreductase RutF
MPEHEEIGPFPRGVDREEYDRRRRRILWRMPSGLYVLGSSYDGRRNLMTLNWATQVATAPKLVAVAVETGAVTAGLVTGGKSFTLNLLPRSQQPIVRKFVKPLVDDGNESSLGGFTVRGAPSGAPILEVALAWLDCRLQSTVDCGSHQLFVGEVIDCGEAGEEEVLRMEDTRMRYGG